MSIIILDFEETLKSQDYYAHVNRADPCSNVYTHEKYIESKSRSQKMSDNFDSYPTPSPPVKPIFDLTMVI